MVWKLSGGQAHITDHSNQSVTLMQNARTLDYDEWMLDTFDIPREILPEIRGSSEVFAYTDPDAFFGVKIPIAGVAGDQQAATFGQDCLQPGMAKNTYGTGAFMIVNTGEYVEPGPGVFSPALWTINGKTTFGIEGLANVCGAVVQWLRDGLNMTATTEQIAALAETVPDNGGVYFVPAFAGLGAAYLAGLAAGFWKNVDDLTNRRRLERRFEPKFSADQRDTLYATGGRMPANVRSAG